jgi:hypothetical protein
MSLRSLVSALLLVACAPPVSAEKQGETAGPPEACVVLASCCDELDDDEACRAEVVAGEASDTGGVRCSRALDDYRGLGFCGGGAGGASSLGQGPGCQALAVCCASLTDPSRRADCFAGRDELLAVAGARRRPEVVDDSCAEALDERVAAGDCDGDGDGGPGPVVEGPICQALVACCGTLAPAARAACEASVAQIVQLPDQESRCAASQAAYRDAGLCDVEPEPEPTPTCTLAPPAASACCACPTGKSCAPNGCYNGYLCDETSCVCTKPPTSGPCAPP